MEKKEEQKESSWLFVECLKASVTRDKLPFGARVLAAMTGLGLMLIEPIGRALRLD